MPETPMKRIALIVVVWIACGACRTPKMDEIGPMKESHFRHIDLERTLLVNDTDGRVLAVIYPPAEGYCHAYISYPYVDLGNFDTCVAATNSVRAYFAPIQAAPRGERR